MNRNTQRWLMALCVFLYAAGLSAAAWLRFVSALSVTTAQALSSPSQPAPNVAVQARLQRAYGSLPIAFEANQGHTQARVQFLARGSGHTLFLTADEAVWRLPQATLLRMKLVKANAGARISRSFEVTAIVSIDCGSKSGSKLKKPLSRLL